VDLRGIFGHDTIYNCTNWKRWRVVWNTVSEEKVSGYVFDLFRSG